MRRMIAAMQISLDGFTQGSDQTGEMDWVESWADALGPLPNADAFVQGAGMYPGYADYWSAIEANPESVPPFQTRLPYEREVAYARRAAGAPHYVVSKTLQGVSWPATAQIIADFEPLRALKQAAGGDIYVVGGPTLVSNLLNAGLIDELRLIVHPLLLGGGRPLFEALNGRHQLTFVEATPGPAGRVILTYSV